MENVTKNLRDAAYVTVGLGVIGYQQVQTRTEQLRDRLEARRTQLTKDLEQRFEPVLTQARAAAEQAQTSVRGYISRSAA